MAEPLILTPKVFDTLLCLVRNRGRVLTKDEILQEVWPDTFVEEVNLAVNISTLRKALGEGPQEGRFIATVPGRGYRFVAQVSASVSRTRTSGFPMARIPLTRYRRIDWASRSNRKCYAASVSTNFRSRASNLRKKYFGIAAATVVVILIVAGLSFKFRRPHLSPGLTPQDSILLADFENTTGEPSPR